MRAPRNRTKTTGKTSREPLTHKERSDLFDLLEKAAKNNHDILNRSRELEEAREFFKTATATLQQAENNLANARIEHRHIHADIAPLWHRLPE